MKRIGIYLHIPFCVSKCKYCDFLSAPSGRIEITSYLEALKKEIKTYEKEAGEYVVQSIFFGGGTPTLPLAEELIVVLNTVYSVFQVESEAEITLECNPETVNREKLFLYRKAGFNRISFGLQSTDNEELRRLGRIHTYEKFLEVFQWAREAGFRNCNIDLMSGLPNQTLSSWEKTLARVMKLEPEHISAYSLIIEEGTPFFEMEQKGLLVLPNEDEEREMYERTEELLNQAGYYRYEISNYAKLGRESRHNQIYWTGQEYVGLGLGASSYLDGKRFCNTSVMKEYLENCEERTKLYRDVTVLTVREKMEEFMFLGLRRMEGVSKQKFFEQFGKTMDEVYKEVLKRFVGEGFLMEQNDRIFLTKKGIDVSNVILAEFLLEE